MTDERATLTRRLHEIGLPSTAFTYSPTPILTILEQIGKNYKNEWDTNLASTTMDIYAD